METDSSEVPFLSNIGFMLTYKCTIACSHCIVKAGPKRKEEAPLDHALDWIDQASDYRDGLIRALALTGGEPFYNLENLGQIADYARRRGFIVSVVTNTFWATSREAALDTLRNLPAIQMLSFSTDVYHQKAIPLDCIKNAIWAARKLGRFYNISVCTDNEQSPQYRRIMDDLEAMGEADKINVTTTFPAGRARKYAGRFDYEVTSEPAVSACSVASSPVIFPDGKVVACIGPLLTLPPTHPMFLGDLHQIRLAEIFDRAELNPILHAIRVWGPHKLVSLLRQNHKDARLPREYIRDSACDVCYKLMSDKQIVRDLENILQDDQFLEILAYARVYYLNETKMAEHMQLRAARAESGLLIEQA